MKILNIYGQVLVDDNRSTIAETLANAIIAKTNLRSADLRSAKNMSPSMVATFQFIPPTGAFIAWKKGASGEIVKLLIPANAKRSHGTERKCRASRAKVLAIYNEKGINIKQCVSYHDPDFKYIVGKIVIPDSFSEDRWKTCEPGIHFFITREEAEDFTY